MRQKQAAKYAACFCGAVAWPHRKGYCASGAGLRYMTRTVYGEPDDAAPGLSKGGEAESDEALEFFTALASSAEPR